MNPLSTLQLARLARDPVAMMHYQLTGRLPKAAPLPSGPLIDALNTLPPRLRAAMCGFTVGPELGYMGSRTFHTAEQALRWIQPPHAGSSHPAESWRNKRFNEKLWLDDLFSCCTSYPESAKNNFPHLFNPSHRSPTPSLPISEPSSCGPSLGASHCKNG